MKTFPVTLLLLLLPAACGFCAAFVPAANRRPPAALLMTELRSFPETFERAAKCSENFELCSADELMDLADELDGFSGSFFEEKEHLREKEISDRHDMADLLRKEAELKLRQDYLKNGNLFKEDVEEAVMLKHRDEYLEELDEVADQ